MIQLRPKSLDTILGTFTRVSKDLDRFIDRVNADNDKLYGQRDAIIERITTNDNEQKQATRVRANINKLLV